jgi:benzoyl-CoA reductase/2-hydroxyglutaryl-CoA dehydratase subunit BcrC/BadD/HgdB
VVVGDDFAAVGRRVYPAGRSKEPLRRMAERLMAGPPDSTRGSAVAERARHLARLAQSTHAKAVLFFVVKFCEPELFYLPQLRAELEKTGLRTVVIEADVTDALPHQAVTRVEALMETVS